MNIGRPKRTRQRQTSAVVSVDADEPDFFDSEQVMERVYPLVTPVVNALGLVLLSRRKKGHAYEFPR